MRILKNVLIHCWNRKLIIISYYFSLLLPTYCISNAICFYEQLNNLYVTTSEDGDRYEFTGTALSEEDLKLLTKETESMEIQFRTDEVISEISLDEEMTVKGYGESYLEFHGISIYKGRFFNKEELKKGNNVCIVSDTVAKKNDLELKDQISIHQKKFQVIGISREIEKNVIIVPYLMWEPVYGTEFVQQVITAKGMPQNEELIFEKTLQKLQGKDVKIMKNNLEEISREGRLFVTKMIFPRVVGTIVVTAFSVLNIFIVLLGLMKQKKEQYAIRRAIGASWKSIFYLFVKENIFDMVVAESFLIISFQKLITFFEMEQEVIFDISSIAGVTVVGLAISAFISLFLSKNVMDQNIYKLLQGENI